MEFRNQQNDQRAEALKDYCTDYGKINGRYFFAGWLLGLGTGLTAIYSLDFSAQQIEKFQDIFYLSCFSLASIGALLKERKQKAIHFTGSFMLSLSIFLLGVGAALLIGGYSRS